MSKGFIGVSVIALGLLSGCGTAYKQNAAELIARSSVSDWGTPPPSDHEQKTKAFFENVLKDPYSAQYKFAAPIRAAIPQSGMSTNPVLVWGVDVAINAKNSYGAYVGFKEYQVAWKNEEIVGYWNLDNLGWIYAKDLSSKQSRVFEGAAKLTHPTRQNPALQRGRAASMHEEMVDAMGIVRALGDIACTKGRLQVACDAQTQPGVLPITDAEKILNHRKHLFMPKLRNTVINQIVQNLEYGDFCLEDFEVKFPDDSSTLASITFIAYPKYSFEISEEYSGGIAAAFAMVGNVKKTLQTTEQPGEYKNFEKRNHENINSCISRVSDWVRNIRQDLIYAKHTVQTTVDELTENLRKQVNENIKDPESYFDEQEKESIKKKLDELQAKVRELEKRFCFPEEEIKKVERAIEKSKKDVDVYPKGVWYKTAGNKVINALRSVLKTKEGREALLEMMKKLLSQLSGI